MTKLGLTASCLRKHEMLDLEMRLKDASFLEPMFCKQSKFFFIKVIVSTNKQYSSLANTPATFYGHNPSDP